MPKMLLALNMTIPKKRHKKDFAVAEYNKNSAEPEIIQTWQLFHANKVNFEKHAVMLNETAQF